MSCRMLRFYREASKHLARETENETLFMTMLRKMGFPRVQFDKNMEELSEGQRKKVILAKSPCERASYMWMNH